MKTQMQNANEIRKQIRRSMGNYPRATKVEILDCEGSLMIAVRYHETDVARCYLSDDGSKVKSIVLASGGWLSKTTAERMNSVLRCLATKYYVRFTYKRSTAHRGVFGLPRQMGDTLYDQKFTLVTRWAEGVDPEGTGAAGMLRTELPFEENMCVTRKRSGWVLERPSKAAQKKLAKVVFAKR